MLLNNRKNVLFIAVAAMVIALISFAVVYGLRMNASQAATQSAATAKQANATVGTKENPHMVSLTKDQTKPVDLLINIGDYVQFNSKDGSEHQIIQGKPTQDHGHASGTDALHEEEHGEASSPLDSGPFQSDEGYRVQFNELGKYDFHDNYNHDYTITVIVYDKDKKIEDTKIQ